MMFEVFHRQVPSFRDNDIEILTEMFPGGFVKVANVQTDDIGRVFELTNHIDGAWWENKGVAKTVERARSTSVGDVIVAADGTRYTINGFGLQEF